MPVLTRQIGPCFAAEVDGIDMTKPLSEEEVDAIHAGMNEHAVLVFHDQDIEDEQQLVAPQTRVHLTRDGMRSLRRATR